MTSADPLVNLIPQCDLDLLPVHLRENLCGIIRMKDYQISSSAEKCEQLQADLRDRQRELNGYRMKHQMAEEFSLKMREQLRAVEETLQKARRDYYDIVIEKESLVHELEISKQNARRLQDEQKNCEFLVKSKCLAIEALQKEVEELGKKLEAVTEDKKESSLQAEKVELQEMSLKHQMNRIANEREFYQKQVDSLNHEINNLTAEITNLRKEKSTQMVEMQSRNDEGTDTINKLQEELNSLRELSDKKDQHIDSLARRIKEINDASVQFEIQYQAEIDEMKNLAQHHSDAYEKEKRTNQQLLDTLEEMQKLLVDGQQAQQDLEETFTRATMDFQKIIKSKDEAIKNLDDEITKLKAQAVAKIQEDMEEEVDHYFPSASATHKVFKSNMSLSQIYNEYIVLQDKFEESQTENNRLKEQLCQLVEEAEQKTPFIHQKVQENRKSLQTIKDLHIQLTKATNEKDSLIEEKENLIQMNNYLTREISRLEQVSQDLALQVRSLIKSVHEAKGYEVAKQDITNESSTEESTANRVITKYLITFDDIESLQVNNQRLISSVRDLAADNEKLAKLLEEKETISQKELNDAFEEIRKLTEERRRQAEMLGELMQAKSALKSMVNSDESSRRSPGFISKDSTRMTMNETLIELKESLKRIQAEAAANKADYQQKMKELSDDVDIYRKQLASMQTEKATIEAQSEYLQEKMKLLQANFELTKKENAKLTDKNGKLSRKLAKSEGNLSVLKKEIADIKLAGQKLEASIRALQSERDLLRNNEKLLTQERDALNRDYQEKSKLISTLQKIQENFQRLESESSKGLNLQLEKLEKEVNYFKSRLADEEQKNKTLVQAHSKQINDLNLKIDQELKKNAELRDSIVLNQTRLHVVESELKVLRSHEEQARARSREEVRDNPEQTKKIREMEEALASAETKKKELTDENEQLKIKVNEKEEKTKKLALQARQRIATLTHQKKTLETEKEALTKKISELEQRIALSDSQMSQNKKRLEDAEKLARSASSQAKTFKTENDNLSKIISELREKNDLLEQSIKKNNARIQLQKSNLASGSAIKLNRQSKAGEEIATTAHQGAQLTPQLSSTYQQSTSAVPSTVGTSSYVPTPSSSSSTTSTSSSSGALIRHPVLPQKQETTATKSTPRASIRPLPVSRLPTISRSTSSTPSNVAVVAVQPNTEDNAQLVPQATVAPTVVAPTAAASSSEPIMSSSTSTTLSSTTLSSANSSTLVSANSSVLSSVNSSTLSSVNSSTMSSANSSTVIPVNSSTISSGNNNPITSSEATPQPRPAEVTPSTREIQSSELRITSSNASSSNANQEPSVTTSDESGETSRQGLKRQRESPSTSRPQMQEDDSAKKVRLDEVPDQEIMFDTEQDVTTHEHDDESKESEVNDTSPDQALASGSAEAQHHEQDQHLISGDSCDSEEENEQEEEEEEENEEENEEAEEEDNEEEAEEEEAEEEVEEEAEEEAEEAEEEEAEEEEEEEEDDEEEDEDDEEEDQEEEDVEDDGDEDDVTIIQP